MERAKKTHLASDRALPPGQQCVAFCQPPDLTASQKCLIHEMEATTHSFLHWFLPSFSHSLVCCVIPFAHPIQSNPNVATVPRMYSLFTVTTREYNRQIKGKHNAYLIKTTASSFKNKLPNIVKIFIQQSLVRRETYRLTGKEMYWFY